MSVHSFLHLLPILPLPVHGKPVHVGKLAVLILVARPNLSESNTSPFPH